MKIMAIFFYASQQTQLRALKLSGWCDTYFVPPHQIVGGVPGTISDVEKLEINFSQYDAALIFHEGLSPAQKYFCEQCLKNNIRIYANQHGFNKSILQIVDSTPNIYSSYWNSMGKYFLDRFEEIMAKNPVSQRWINIGSITHDYLYKNFKWNCHANNGKALIIHEPNLKDCEGDPFPHESEDITDYAISSIISSGIKVDMKPHPNWKNFIGNDGAKLKKPDNVNIVDISVEEIVNYSLIVGSRSTMLLDAVAMGIPTLAIESISGWQDDNYPPVQHGLQGLVPTCPLKDFSKGLADFFNREPNYDIALRNYFLGPLGQVSENYYNFIQFDLKNTY